MGRGTGIEKDGRILFSDGRLELEFDRSTGRWLGLRDLAGGGPLLRGGGLQAPAVLTVGGVTTSTFGRGQAASVVDAKTVGADAACTGYSCRESAAGPVLSVVTRDGDWRLEHRFALRQVGGGAARVDRALRIEYAGAGTRLLRAIEVRVPPADLGPVRECFVEAPGYPTKAHQPLSSLPLGEPWKRVLVPMGHGAPGWTTGFFALDNPSRPLTLGIWCFDPVESCQVLAVRTDAGLRVSHVVDLAARFAPGTAVEWEGQHLLLRNADWRETMEGFTEWYDETGWKVPDDVPGWARSTHIYNCLVGYSWCAPNLYPRHEELIDDLPRIRDLGFDLVYTKPHEPFPGYDFEDFRDADLHYGSADGLRRLVKRAHELGMRVMIDLAIHGIVDQEMADRWRDALASDRFAGHPMPPRNRYRVEHPEWFMRTETGGTAATFTWAFDHANEGMRAFLAETLAWYVREFGVDGFRIDAPTWIPFPNWAEGLPYRASASIYGSAGLFEEARAVVHAARPDVMLYSEAPGPVFMRGFDAVYNYDLQWLFSALLMPKSEKGYTWTAALPDERIDAADLGPWLEQLRLARPRGAVTVHHLDSADTFGWSCNQFRREVFGVPAARALFGLCVAIAGSLMSYSGAEQGMEEFTRSLLALKRALPALDRGAVDYLAVRVDDRRVFSALRTLGGQAVIPVVNVADRLSTARLALDPAVLPVRGAAFRVVDRLDGTVLPGPSGPAWRKEELGAIVVPLSPFQVRVLEIVPAA